MIATALNEFKNHLSSYLEKASEQDIVITSDGRRIGVLTGFVDEDDYLEYRFLNKPGFQGIIGRSREEAREGRVTRLEDIE
uniref:Prevent-host-death family protein n=1 Tax=Candidatus Kentrum sp. TC TaxID=2126339 RepID=A0A450YXA1_9GAMM|nr:MAG: prevent-host-death family protein [Candidatus Kentron sp. TC]VFK46153.1 MAG: prevent-host-death family protein [Candidatus Kentron sp. TC]VFK54127.1 MAG: prevent-host-death family protein [Candidatus Kentron sp. TC]